MRGFTLVELLVVVAIISVMRLGPVGGGAARRRRMPKLPVRASAVMRPMVQRMAE